MSLHKYDIINGLAAARGLSRYLEICTPTTGMKFQFVDKSQFTIRDRLMYRCPDTHDDGLEIAFRTAADTSHELVRTIQRLQPKDGRYDLVFVDSWHGYAASVGDMHGALSLLRPGGVIVVHDCNPTDPDTVCPQFREGAWCGVTYQAFIDFVLAAQPAGYCVVDSDYGCGVVFSSPAALPGALRTARPDRRMVFEWAVAREADATRYRFFDRNRAALLNLVDPFVFADACDVPLPAPLPASAPQAITAAPTLPDPALTIVADGAALELGAYQDGWHRFALPPTAKDIRVRSTTMSPSDTAPESPDKRRLGLAVAAVMIGDVRIDLADPALGEGWYSDEAAAGYPWRWTNGDARVRVPKGTPSIGLFTTNRPI